MRDSGLDPDREHAPRELRERFYQQLTDADYQACGYHDADWRTIAGQAVRIVNELGETPQANALDRALATANVREADRGGLWSLFVEPLMWSGDEFVNGQHRSCALRASAAAAVVRAVEGPHGPPSTWTITDDA